MASKYHIIITSFPVVKKYEIKVIYGLRIALLRLLGCTSKDHYTSRLMTVLVNDMNETFFELDSSQVLGSLPPIPSPKNITTEMLGRNDEALVYHWLE